MTGKIHRSLKISCNASRHLAKTGTTNNQVRWEYVLDINQIRNRYPTDYSNRCFLQTLLMNASTDFLQLAYNYRDID